MNQIKAPLISQPILNLYEQWRHDVHVDGDFNKANETIARCVPYVQEMKMKGYGFKQVVADMIEYNYNLPQPKEIPKSDNFQRRVFEMFHGWENVEVIIFSGKQGSGKTTSQNALAKVLKESGYASMVEEYNLADPIYEAQNNLLNAIKFKYKIPHQVKVCRPLLQAIGTDFGRDFLGKNVWVDILKDRINALNNFPHHSKDEKRVMHPSGQKYVVIIGDVRFPNEFDLFPAALRIRLYAPEEKRKLRAAKWGNTKHRSEIGLDKYHNAGKFDMYIDTSEFDDVKQGTDHVVSLVLSRMQRKGWEERRGRVENIPAFQETIYPELDYGDGIEPLNTAEVTA